MISGAGVVAFQSDTAKLRVNYNKVFRQLRISQEASITQSRRRRLCIEVVCKRTDVAIRDELVRCGRGTQRLRTCQRGAIHRPDTSNSDSVEQPVEQLRIATGARDV